MPRLAPGAIRKKQFSPGRRPIPIGEKSGGLVVLERLERHRNGNYFFLRCSCECGREAVLSTAAFRRRTCCQDCSRVSSIEKRLKHNGATRSNQDPLYSAYKAMLNRCGNPKNKSFKWYGAKGITVCPEWRSGFGAFRDWALANGWEKGLTLDRVDSKKGYAPENCEYVSKSVNSKRMREQYYFVPRKSSVFAETFPIEALWGHA